MPRFFLLLLLVTSLFSCRQEELRQHEADILAIENYLSQQGITAERDSEADFFYSLYVNNDRAYKPPRDWGLTMEVRYKASLLDGTVVEETGSIPVRVEIDQSIYGWRLAMPLMSKGEKMLLFLPSRLAYGSESSALIPAHSILMFDIELLEIYPQF
ncbi:MAG: FKBP-type peptidyl-prolyl cis-trans isomerase [Aureispira sp.]